MREGNYRKQFPGKQYTFIRKKTGERDIGILPSKFGKSNSFAKWHFSSRYGVTGGVWRSVKFHHKDVIERQSGRGPSGLLGRIRHLLAQHKWHAKQRGHETINATPEYITSFIENSGGACTACGEKLSFNDGVLDHCHETGNFRGFIHQRCNKILGYAKDECQLLRSLANYAENNK
jgi:hypothetical protein